MSESNTTPAHTEIALLGGGCFWGVEETFRRTDGVVSTAVGYAGGTTNAPSYEDVCTDRTGHAEVVRIEFDPNIISYEALLGVFFELHDPTQVNRQGPDIGTQYRTVIFTTNDAQRDIAERVKAQLDASEKYDKPIATAIEPAPAFHRAEDYHQQYLAKRGLGACSTGH